MTMDYNLLEICVENARGLPNVRLVDMEMKVFVEVSISGRPNTKLKIVVDETHSNNPIWKCPMKFTTNDYMLLNLHFQIYCKCFANRKRLIGEVYVPVRELSNKLTVLRCQRDVETLSGEAHGVLTFKYVVKQGPPLPSAEENGHQHGKIHRVLLTIFGKFFVSAGAASTATIFADVVTGGS